MILPHRGPRVGSNVSYGELITMAHRAIERQPGEGVAVDEDVRRIAQSAKTIVGALGPMRNQRGTGLGVRTVETHLANIYAKVGVHSRVQPLRRAAEILPLTSRRVTDAHLCRVLVDGNSPDEHTDPPRDLTPLQPAESTGKQGRDLERLGR